jgi:methylenetetrahydrofolate dehydrogenase (NADP+)/methenyltetrahydrofolate cyclohydrolase
MIIDGKALAQQLRHDVRQRVAALNARGLKVGFAAVLVGEHAPSVIYVRNKLRAMEEAGIRAEVKQLPATATQDEVLKLITAINEDKSVHGILLQLPLPPHLQAKPLIAAIAPEKDVDGLTLINVGRRTLDMPCLLPCTPKGCLKLIKTVQQDLSGLHAVVIGRSDLVGKPMAQLLLREDCTVTQMHSATRNLPELCRQADIVVAAMGSPETVKGDWLKPGAIVIDIGINRVGDKIIGDVEFASASKVARAITPVPGGVGPMTIACLLENTVEAAELLFFPK